MSKGQGVPSTVCNLGQGVVGMRAWRKECGIREWPSNGGRGNLEEGRPVKTSPVSSQDTWLRGVRPECEK